MPGVGWCATKVSDAGTRMFRCIRGRRPSCWLLCSSTRIHGATTPTSRSGARLFALPGHVLPDALTDSAAACRSMIRRNIRIQ